MTVRKNSAAPAGQAQGGALPYARVEAAVFTTMYGTQEAEWPAAGGGAEEGAGRPVTAAEVEDIVRRVLAGTTLYVLESDITPAQNAVKGVVEQTFF